MYKNIKIKTDTKISFDTLKQSIIHNLQVGMISYLQIGLDLKSAQSNLEDKEYKKLLKDTLISTRDAQRYMKVATDERIQSVNQKLLPTAHSTAHYLSQLTDKDFKKVKSKIAPTNTKKFYEELLNVTPTNNKTTHWKFFEINISKKVTRKDYLELKQELNTTLDGLEDDYDSLSYDENEKVDDNIYIRDKK